MILVLLADAPAGALLTRAAFHVFVLAALLAALAAARFLLVLLILFLAALTLFLALLAALLALSALLLLGLLLLAALLFLVAFVRHDDPPNLWIDAPAVRVMRPSRADRSPTGVTKRRSDTGA
jgi:hypothetical protein